MITGARRRGPASRTNPPQDLEAVDVGEHHVEHDEVELAGARLLGAFAAAADDLDLVALRGQRVLEAHADRRIVFDDEDASHGVVSVGMGNRIVNFAPRPSSDSTSTVPPSASM